MQKKKSLGQHFLHSSKIIFDIVAAGNIRPDDIVLEIGSGEGTLTSALLQTGAHVISVEKDDRLIPVLQEKFAKEISIGQFRLIHQDILQCSIESLILSDLDAVRGGQKKGEEAYSLYGDENFLKSNKEMRQMCKYKLVANIPYYITGQILRMFLEAKNQPKDMVLLVQKEVAERIVAKENKQHGKESLLSLSVKAFGEPKIIRIVKKGSFNPPPKVDSAVLHISDISRKRFVDFPRAWPWGKAEKLFFECLHAGFAHKRKQLLPNLLSANFSLNLQNMPITKDLLTPSVSKFDKGKIMEVFEKADIDPKARAEDIPLETWVKLCKNLENYRKKTTRFKTRAREK